MLNIYRWSQTDAPTKKKISARAMFDISEIHDYVAKWMEIIRSEGDEGIVKYTREFDNKNFQLKDLKVTRADIEKAYAVVNPRVVEVIQRQISISRENAVSKARQETVLKSFVPGVQVGYKITPIESVGLAVPAGQVPLPTVMQILTVTAKAAGVPRVIACYPYRG
jgi:histidinol dehydrogenase